MAVSDSTDFALTVTEIVTEARRKTGIQASEEPLQSHELDEGKTALNMMLKSWEADGVQTWVLTEGTLTLVQGTYSYSFGSGGDFTTLPMDIETMRIARSSTEIPMYRLSRDDYYELPNKSTQGYPTNYYYDRQRDSGTLKVWPAPDSGTGTLNFTYRRRIMDADAGTDNIDLPQEWYEAVVYNLADRIAENYGRDVPKVTARAMQLYAMLKAYDTAEGMGSVSIRPDR